MVLHELTADGAPAIDIVVLGCRRVVGVAISHFAQRYTCTVHFAYGIDLFVPIREGQGISILSQRLIPVDAGLVAICFEAKLASCHLIVGNIGTAARRRCCICILLKAVAIGVRGTFSGITPRESAHGFHFCNGDTVDVVHRLSRCYPASKAVIVALIASYLDGRETVDKGTAAGCIADEACVRCVGSVVNIDADDATNVLEPCVVAPVPSG